MSSAFSFSELEVAGYSDRLLKEVTPAVVPPLFRLKNQPDRYVVPPFRYQDGKVINGTVLTEPEVRKLDGEERITLFKEVFAAQERYELWLDQDLIPHYEVASAVRERLSEIAAEEKRLAEEALAEGHFDDAERHCRSAVAANDRSISQIALAAAIAQAKGNPIRVERMRDVAEQAGDLHGFEVCLEHYLKRLCRGPREQGRDVSASKYAGLARLKRAA